MIWLNKVLHIYKNCWQLPLGVGVREQACNTGFLVSNLPVSTFCHDFQAYLKHETAHFPQEKHILETRNVKLVLMAPSNYFPGSSFFSFLYLVIYVIAFCYLSVVIPPGIGVRVQTRGRRSWFQTYLPPLFVMTFLPRN